VCSGEEFGRYRVEAEFMAAGVETYYGLGTRSAFVGEAHVQFDIELIVVEGCASVERKLAGNFFVANV
jgi:hypothetical protein